jgi:F-type H+-transporting ATPase subunit delta
VAAAQRIYARALFEAARDRGRLEAAAGELQAFAAAVRETPELESFLANPQLEPAAKAAVLEQLAAEADELVRNTLRLLAEKGRAGEIPAVSDELQALVDRARGRVSVELTTAYELSDEEAAAIVRKIEQASGRTVEASRKVDADLIGGVVLRAGSLRVDASVRGRLERLRRDLVSGR